MAPLAVHVNTGDFRGSDEEQLAAAVMHTLRTLSAPRGEISLTLVDDAEIGRLNLEYLGREGPTDVIAFSLGDAGELLGDVYVGAEQAERQARELGVPLAEELVRLAVHGTLHLLGYDHPEGPERELSEMFEVQERLVSEVVGGS